jgi:D-glycero-alpha-D-manno-heptose-7-phosphate kinase
MHQIKQSAIDMKTELLKGDIHTFAHILGKSWENKKKMESAITNSIIQQSFDTALNMGAIAGKVSGAGGGGFIMFVVEPTKKLQVINALNKLNGRVIGFNFSEGGTHGWKIYDRMK